MSYHIHFGAGRIGLGLVLPIFLRLSRSIAIFQRPDHNQEWNVLCGSEKVDIYENGNKTSSFVAVMEDFRGSISDLVDRGEPLFVSATRRDLILPILQAASSFSTAVGPCGFADVISGMKIISKFERRCRLYAFENDIKALQQFESQLRAHTDLVDVVHVMCDRICTKRAVCRQRVEVITEAYRGIAVLLVSRDNKDFDGYPKGNHPLSHSYH